MKYYAGIDLHTRKSVVCVIDQKERKLVMETAPNELPCILRLLEEVPRRPAVAIEATLNWYWLVDGPQEAGYQVKLAHTPLLACQAMLSVEGPSRFIKAEVIPRKSNNFFSLHDYLTLYKTNQSSTFCAANNFRERRKE